jgi:hypothetical protein
MADSPTLGQWGLSRERTEMWSSQADQAEAALENLQAVILDALA